jgi:hypothetical protein
VLVAFPDSDHSTSLRIGDWLIVYRPGLAGHFVYRNPRLPRSPEPEAGEMVPAAPQKSPVWPGRPIGSAPCRSQRANGSAGKARPGSMAWPRARPGGRRAAPHRARGRPGSRIGRDAHGAGVAPAPLGAALARCSA